MLSRTADHLFWMSRYIERAENLARLLDVTWQMSLVPQSLDAANQNWNAIIAITACIWRTQCCTNEIAPERSPTTIRVSTIWMARAATLQTTSASRKSPDGLRIWVAFARLACGMSH